MKMDENMKQMKPFFRKTDMLLSTTWPMRQESSFGSYLSSLMQVLKMQWTVIRLCLAKAESYQRVRSFIKKFREIQFLLMVIANDKTWVCGYNPETKQQSSQWKSSSPPVQRRPDKE